MRQIKFRGICKEEYHTHHEATEVGEFIHGYLVCPNKIRTAMSEEHGGMGSGIVHVDIEVDPETVGEYTGTKDKNGQDIYEGDILRGYERNSSHPADDMTSYYAKVVYDTDKGAFMYSFIPNDYDRLYLDDNTEMEVIGNIYENEDLL